MHRFDRVSRDREVIRLRKPAMSRVLQRALVERELVATQTYEGDVASATADYEEIRAWLRGVSWILYRGAEMQCEAAAVLMESIAKLKSHQYKVQTCSEASMQPSAAIARISQDIEKRMTTLDKLQHVDEKMRRTKIFFKSAAYWYQKFARYRHLLKLQLDEASYAARISKLVLDSQAESIALNAQQMLWDLRLLLRDIQLDHTCYSAKILHGILLGLRRRNVLLCELYPKVMECTQVLMSIEHLSKGAEQLGHNRLHYLLIPFYNLVYPMQVNLKWARQILPKLASSGTHYSEPLASKLADIDNRAAHILQEMTMEVQFLMVRFRTDLWTKMKTLDSVSMLALTESTKRQAINQILKTCKTTYHSPSFQVLRSCGYKPSRWLQRLCEPKLRRRKIRYHRAAAAFRYYPAQLPAAIVRYQPVRSPAAATRYYESQLPVRNIYWVPRLSSSRGRAGQHGRKRPSMWGKRRVRFDSQSPLNLLFSTSNTPAKIHANLFPPKGSALRRTCAMLGFEEPPTKETKGKTEPGKGQGRTTASPREQPDRSRKPGIKKVIPRNHTVVDVNGSLVRGVPTDFARGTLRFNPSPTLRAPHPTPFYPENPFSEQDLIVVNNTVNGHTNGAGDQYTDGDSTPSTSHNNTSEQGRETPNTTAPDNEQHASPSSNDMGEQSDLDHPTERERESESEDESEDELDVESDAEESQEEHIPLSYQIPEDLLYAAMQASPNTRMSYWSQKLYRGPNDELLSTHYCKTFEVAERVAKYFVDEKVLGFDIEWKPWASPTSMKGNASLIQLACENRIALFHIALFPGTTPEQVVPPTLKALLEDPNIYKVGVAVKGDFKRLKNHLDIEARGVIELSRLHNLVEHYATDPSKVTMKLVSLAKQVQQHLLLPLYKGEPLSDRSSPDRGSVRESDWSKLLNTEQIHYAAADAYAGFRLWDVLESKRKKLKPTPPLPRLCDHDPETDRTKAGQPRAKVVKKPKEAAVGVSAEAVEAEEVEEDAEDTQEYETAPEELADNEEMEPSESSESGDSDAEYVPRSRKADREQVSEDSAPLSRVQTRRVGRVDFSRLASADPGYPTLPGVSSDEVDSDESEAFDPPPEARLQRRDAKDPESDSALPVVQAESQDDEYADPELEGALIAMDIDEKPAETTDPDLTGTQMESSALQHKNDVDSKVQVDNAEDMDIDSNTTPTNSVSSTPPPPTFSPLPADTTAHTPEYIQASEWAQSYLARTIPSPSCSSSTPSRIRATIPHLRAYHLWHHQHIPFDAIGAHIRDPPLTQSTVSSYILQAVTLERLEYRDEDLRSVLQGLPLGLRLGRWRWLNTKMGVVR